MKTIPAALLVLAAVVALVVTSGSAPVPAQPAPKAAQWEYKVLPLTYQNAPADEAKLNELGADGWEVVAGTAQARNTNASPTSDARLVLKRAKR